MWIRRNSRGRGLPIPASDDDLARIGEAAFPSDGFSTRLADVGMYYLPALEAFGSPPPGSDQWTDFVDQYLEQLTNIADDGDGWALAGAFTIARDLLGAQVDSPRYAELIDRTLVFLRDSGVPHELVPPFALDRWCRQFGREGLRPAHWPGSIVPS